MKLGPEPNLVGKTVREAEALAERAGYVTRIWEINGKGLIVTCDLHMDRINLSIQGKPYKYGEDYSDSIVIKQQIG